MSKRVPPTVILNASGAAKDVACGGRHERHPEGDRKLYPTSAHWFECRTCEGNHSAKEIAAAQRKQGTI